MNASVVSLHAAPCFFAAFRGRSSAVEQLPFKQLVGGSIPPALTSTTVDSFSFLVSRGIGITEEEAGANPRDGEREARMAEEKGFFDFEKLTVYRRALEFADFVFPLCRRMAPEYRSSVADQLQRAVVSIANNIAEGAGKLSHRETIKYYSYALDSAKECVPPLTIARRQAQIDDGELAAGREHCEAICKMLVKLIQSVEARELRREVRDDPSLFQ